MKYVVIYYTIHGGDRIITFANSFYEIVYLYKKKWYLKAVIKTPKIETAKLCPERVVEVQEDERVNGIF
jgi:hypothetical protein